MGGIFLNRVNRKHFGQSVVSSGEQLLMHGWTIVTVDEAEAVVVDGELPIRLLFFIIYLRLLVYEDHLYSHMKVFLMIFNPKAIHNLTASP
jgi:hypothetical protein